MSGEFSPVEVPARDSKKSPALLIVDDEEMVREVLRRRFEEEGCRIFACAGAREALGLLETEPIDAILSDIRMPDMSGIEFLRVVRERSPDLPFILMTGYGDAKTASEAVNLGADAYLLKPLDMDYAAHCVERAIERYALLAEKKEEERKRFEKLGELSERVRSNLIQIMNMLRGILKEKNPYLAEHGVRVSALAGHLARKMKLDEAAVAEIKAAALLMDVGMILENNQLAHGQLYLQQAPQGQVRFHGPRGKQILSNVITNHRLLRLVECHHERWDGEGPLGIADGQIPVGARILAVADAYCALTADAPQHEAITPERAGQFLQKMAGRVFDPQVVRVFLSAGSSAPQDTAAAASQEADERVSSAQALASPQANIPCAEGIRDFRAARPKAFPSVSMEEMRRRLEEEGEIDAVSFVAVKVAALCRSPHAEVGELARFVEKDPAIASRILRVANSSLYNRGRPVADLQRAISGIGMRGIGEIVTSMLALDRFANSPDNLSVRPEWFWEHCIACGLLARSLYSLVSDEEGEEDPFLAGLFHDIGRAALDRSFPDEYHPMLQEAADKGYPLEAMEKEGLGLTHMDVGALLLERWGLGSFVPLIACHHRSLNVIRAKAGGKFKLAACIALANALAKAAGIGFGGSTVLDPFHEISGHFKIGGEDLWGLLDEARNEISGLKLALMSSQNAGLEGSYRDALLKGKSGAGKGLFSGDAARSPDEVETFLSFLGLLARADEGPPRFIVHRPAGGLSWRECIAGIRSREQALGLDPLPAIMLVDEKFEVPADYRERPICLVGVPTSTKILLEAIGAVTGQKASPST